jgi:DNA-binding protein HU-beta
MEVRMAKVMSKSELIQKIAEMHSNKNMARKDVKAVIESLAEIGYKELNKSGAFLVPGFAKFVVIKKPATIRSQRNQQYLRRSRLGRSSRLGR